MPFHFHRLSLDRIGCEKYRLEKETDRLKGYRRREDMFEFEKMCKAYETLTYDERADILAQDAEVILPAIEEVTGGTHSFEILVLAACAADGHLDVEEYSLYKDATGMEMSFDEVRDELKTMKTSELMAAADEVVDGFGDLDMEIKESMVSFCLCLCSADGRIGLRERSFIKKLIQ